MTYTPHILVQFGGRLYDIEEWSCSLRMLIDGQSILPDEDLIGWAATNLVDIKNDVAAWFTSAGAANSNKARLDFVKVNAIDDQGHYSDQGNTNAFFYTAGAAPTGINVGGFPQETMCVSLMTAKTRGRGHRGRFFPPTAALTPDSLGKVSSAIVTGMATAAATFLTNLNNQPGIDTSNPAVAVVSNLGDPGPANVVTHILVGNQMDTQRRRRENMPEAYTSATVTT